MPAPIIVGLALREDDSAPLALARRLARLADAPLALVTVMPHEVPAHLPTPDYARALHDETARRLRAVAQRLGDGAASTTHVLQGSPAGAMHRLAQELGAAAVVVGSTHRGAVGRLLIGQVATGLLHGSGCPVAIAPRGYQAPEAALQRIGIAYDGTREARVALAAAIGLAQRTSGAVFSYTVREPIDPIPRYTPPGLPPPEVADAQRGWAQATAAEALAAIPEAVRGASEVLNGHVVQELARVSAELDLLVCGSRGHGSVRQVLAGSVARGLAHAAACPLLTVPRELSAAAPWRTRRAVGTS